MHPFQTPRALSQYLGLPVFRIHDILGVLIRAGLAIQDGERYRAGPTSIHLGTDSPMLVKHHINWRMRAIQDLERGSKHGHLHYSSVVTVAEADIPKVQSIMVAAIEQIRAVVKESKENRLYCYNMDLFEAGEKF